MAARVVLVAMSGRITHPPRLVERLVKGNVVEPSIFAFVQHSKRSDVVGSNVTLGQSRRRGDIRVAPPQEGHPAVGTRRDAEMCHPFGDIGIIPFPRPHRHRRDPLPDQTQPSPSRTTIGALEESLGLATDIESLGCFQIERNDLAAQR